MSHLSPRQVADELDRQVRALDEPGVDDTRRVRREWSRALRQWPGDDVLAVALGLVGRHRWVAYELVYHHGDARSLLDAATVEKLGDGLASWVDVDCFARYISGPAWQRGRLGDQVIEGWAVSPDRWWRRAALVSTVPLNLRAAGGTGDRDRTLAVCSLLVDDRDDMVVKAMSWALRALVPWDPDAVRAFLADNDARVAARVRREVVTKLETGRKTRPR
jgi:3-methyladenine DNA glycosylase AlkD